MKINIDANNANINVENTAKNIASPFSKTNVSHKAGVNGANTTKYNKTIDISGSVMDNNAYAGHGKTAEDVMQEAGAIDIVARRNYMAVMSNTMSKEDFAKLMKDGTHPGNTEVGTVVSIIDHIKAALVKGGTEIHGYTDNLDAEKFAAITGDKMMAQKLANQFVNKMLPPTEHNLESVEKALLKASEITGLSEGGIKYMVENHLPPTIENLYLAQYSGGNDAGKQGKGYFAQDIKTSETGQSVYLAKKADSLDWSKLDPQIEKIIREAANEANASYELNQENLEAGRWLIEKGIALTTDNFTALKQIQEFKLPPDGTAFLELKADEIAAAITAAIADGKNPLNANLLDPYSNIEKAVQYAEEIKQIEEPAIENVVLSEQILNLKNLLMAQRMIVRGNDRNNDRPSQSTQHTSTTSTAQEHQPDKVLTAQRLLLETSLAMTAGANLKLLRSGLNIETTPLEQLLAKLKEAEQSIKSQLVGTNFDVITSNENEAVTTNRHLLYDETITKVSEISSMPAALIARMTRFAPVFLVQKADPLNTLNEIHENGTILKASYDKAGELYEQVMTAPRRDMGDSILKAFRNVDDILSELNVPVNDANRRVIRILGYNSMEINLENIEAVKEKDTQLQDILAKMKPGTVLEMIRQGLNPLTMSLDELQAILNGKNETIADSLDNYSHFLQKLDRKGDITTDERRVYIGVYRLLRQIEKGESRAVGSLIQADMDFSLGNLLTAIRSSRRQGMDYTVDDDFGGVNAIKSDDNLETKIAKLHQTQQLGNENELREELKEIIKQLELDEVNDEYIAEQLKNIQSLKGIENEIIQSLLDSNQPVTANNLLAALNLFKKPSEVHKKADEFAKETDLDEILADTKDNLVRDFTNEASATEAYDNLRKVMTGIFERAASSENTTALDVRELSGLCRQLNLQAAMSTARISGGGYREERYDIPVLIDGEITAINLLVRHDAVAAGKVSCAMNASAFGIVTADFNINNGKISGFVASNNAEGLKKLRENADNLYTALNESEAAIVGDLHFIKSDLTETNFRINSETNENKNSTEEKENSKDAVSNKELYLVAKAFITFIQRIGKEA